MYDIDSVLCYVQCVTYSMYDVDLLKYHVFWERLGSSQGVDMALVTCVALSVQKLGHAWTSRMLVGRTRATCGPC